MKSIVFNIVGLAFLLGVRIASAGPILTSGIAHATDRVEYVKCQDTSRGVSFSIYSTLSSGNENHGFVDLHLPGLNLQESSVSGLYANPIDALRRNEDYVVQVDAKFVAVRIAFPDPYIVQMKL